MPRLALGPDGAGRIRTSTACRLAAVAALVVAACAGPSSEVAPDAAAPPGGFTAPAGWAFPAPGAVPVYATGGMVATTDRVASDIGAEVLRRGGNAVDAAVATHFALAVVNPEAGNIGGGGFMVLRMADGRTAALDFRETAPAAASRDMYLDANGAPTDGSRVGHLAAGVPGSVAGLWEAHQRFGSLPWADLVQPAVTLAEGLVVHPRLASSLQAHEAALRRYPATAAVFLAGGRAPRVGDRLVQRDLSDTLGRIAREGRDGFYRGRTAALVESEMRRGGGILTRDDLAGYEAVWRDPLRFSYRGRTIVSMPPPSSGGVAIAQILQVLQGYDLAGLGHLSAEHVHLWAEASRRAFADRNTYLADPDFVRSPVAELISTAYAERRRAEIRADRATPSADVRAGAGPAPGAPAAAEGAQTTHYSIVDAEGAAVAVTTTINSLYGSLVTVAGAGFLLNNEMDDFAVRPGTPNQFGLVQGDANAIEPGKRMLSSMAPTLVLDGSGRVRLVTGSPGGPTIISTVAQLVSNVVDFGMEVGAASAAPRIHHQHLPDVLYFERGGLRPETVSALETLGHVLEGRPGYQGDAQSIGVLPDGVLAGVSDPRSGGAAAGVAAGRPTVQ